jgi:uncharacterized protein (DUF697 family)
MKEAKVKEATPVETAPVEAATEVSNAAEGREDRLEKLSKYHILASMGIGLVPFPIVDMVALMGIQLNMVRKLCAEYGVPFKQDAGKSVISSLLGGILPVPVGLALISLLKFVPVIGLTTGAVTMPVVSGASTYAIYKVFVKHFEAGGTFLNLDPSKFKSYFSEQFAKGKKYATDLKGKDPAKTEA